MTLYHLLQQHWGAGSATGVPRFSRYFQQAFPKVVNITPNRLKQAWKRGDVVVTDNHLSLMVPDHVRTIVVHHGCAETHYRLDPAWRSDWSRQLVIDQQKMFDRPNRDFVAPSKWVKEQFEAIKPPGIDARTYWIPHHVPLILGTKDTNTRPRVIGDWRGHNKGEPCIPRLRELCPEIDFVQISFPPGDDAAREKVYRSADCYLCLSLSEGGSYSLADAEAARLPIIMTRVGFDYEFGRYGATICDRDDLPACADLIRASLTVGRTTPSFYEDDWGYFEWQNEWQDLINLREQQPS